MEFHSETALFFNKHKKPYPINKRTPNKNHPTKQMNNPYNQQNSNQKKNTCFYRVVLPKILLHSLCSKQSRFCFVTEDTRTHHMVQRCLQNHQNCQVSFLNKFKHKRVVFDTHEHKITFTGTRQQQVDCRKKAL